MTKDEAIIEAAKREKNKSKHLNHKRWSAVHDNVKGWGVVLEDTPQHVFEQSRAEAKEAFFNNDMNAFQEACGKNLLAKCNMVTDSFEKRYGKLSDADMIAAIQADFGAPQ
mgnify:CR=1 FL=1